MIIGIFGKSGSGKSYLADKLANDLPSSIHIDLDVLNRDLMNIDYVISDAVDIFGTNDIITNGVLDSRKILDIIMQDNAKYTKWTDYMTEACNDFLIRFIVQTSFDYYILDHINVHKLPVTNDAILIECLADFDTRLIRLTQREQITQNLLDFRDINYMSHSSDITYNSDNYDEVLKYIENK